MMIRTQRILMTAFVATIAVCVAVAMVFESGLIEEGALATGGPTEFYVTLALEMLTIACIPGALKLFSLPSVRRRIEKGGANALLPLALLRMALLGLPLLLNTLLYYMFMIASFGYLALLLLISMVFVYPSMARCESETNTEREEERKG